MDQIKSLTQAIDQATSQSLQLPNLQLYNNVQILVNLRADMPKHCILHLSKRIMIKNKKVMFLILDLLEYLCYQTQLSLYTQIATKDFLLKLSGILQSKDFEETIKQKVLCTIRCWEQLFQPHKDILPLFFQFYDGLVKKGFDQKREYYSPYRPKELKKYLTKAEIEKKNTTFQNSKKLQPIINKPSENANSSISIQSVRQQIILTNEVIDECNPAQGVKNKTFLNQLLSTLKQSEKVLIKIINESTDQKAIQEAIALNDDLIITYRRYKQLQKNKKPQPFIKTELDSNFQVKSTINKIQNKTQISFKNNSINQNNNQNSIDILSSLDQPKKQQIKQKPSNNNDILNMLDFNQPPIQMNTMSTPILLQPNYIPNQSQLNIKTNVYQPNLNFSLNQQSFIKNPNIQPTKFIGNNNFNTLLLNNPASIPITLGTLNNTEKMMQTEFKTQADFKAYNQDVNSLVDLTDLFSKKL